jgi:hypothetical protein
VAKTFGGATISNGGTTTLIFTLTNSSGDPAQSGIALGYTLPTNLLLNSATPAVSYSTGSAGPATATYTSGTRVLSGLTSLAMSSGTASCTVTVAGLTHVSGQTNASCSSNPAGFTNLASNVTTTGATNASTDQCLVVQTATAVTLSKTGAATAIVSGSVDYSLTLTNTGTAATGTTLHVLDQLPIGVTATAVMGLTNMAAGGVSCTNLNVAGGLLDCTVTLTTPMAAGTGTTSASFKVTTMMPSAVPNPALLTNYASTDPTGGSTPTMPGSSCSGSECGSQGTTVTATAPTITKSFTPPTIAPGGISTLTITLANSNAGVAMLTADLTDNLPNDLMVASPPNIGGTCLGTKVAAAGSQTVTLRAGGSIPVNSSCIFTVDVTSYLVGEYLNEIPVGALQTNYGSNPAATQAQLAVVARPGLVKAFNPVTVAVNQPSRLTLTLDNPNGAAITLGAALIDHLPTGLILAADPVIQKTCPDAPRISSDRTSFIYPIGAHIPVGSCSISALVVASQTGTYDNTIPAEALQTNIGTNPSAATAQLVVTDNTLDPVVAKTFNPASIAQRDISRLSILLGNVSAQPMTLSQDLVDNLPSGVVVANPPNPGGTCPGSLTALAGSSSVGYASGSAIPVGDCQLQVDVTSTVVGAHPNTIPAGALKTTAGGESQDPATATLTVESATPSVAKAFDPPLIDGGQISRLTLTLGNRGTVPATLQSALVDSFPRIPNLMVANPPNIGGNCPSAALATAGGTDLTYPAGAVIPIGGCTVSVDVTSVVGGAYNNVIPAGSLQTDQGNYPEAMTATLIVDPADIVVTKTMVTQGPYYPGMSVVYAITVTNLGPDPGFTAQLNEIPNNITIDRVTGDCAQFPYQLGGLAVGELKTVQVEATINQGVSSFGNSVTVVSTPYDPDSGNNTATTTNQVTLITPTVGKSFTPASVVTGNTSVLRLELGNANSIFILLDSLFVDALPAGLIVASDPGLSTDCPGSVIANAGASSVAYATNSAIPAGGCSIEVNVVASQPGSYLNQIAAGALSTNFGPNSSAAQAALTVSSNPVPPPPPPPPPNPIPIMDWRLWMLMVGLLWVSAAWRLRQTKP